MVTELGLGAMDTPQSDRGADTIRATLDSGINFIDTAREYEGSEYLIGQVARETGRKDFYVSTKTFSRTRDGCQKDVDKSLGMLGVDKIDLYQLHDVSTLEAWEEVMREGGALEGLRIAQLRGLISHIGVSSHSTEVLEKAIASGEFDAVMLEYSVFFRDTGDLISLAGERDVGVMVMRPLGGSGRMSSLRTRMRAEGPDGLPTPTMLLRYVLSNPDVSVAAPGARYSDRVRANVELAATYEPMDDAEKRDCEAKAQELMLG